MVLPVGLKVPPFSKISFGYCFLIFFLFLFNLFLGYLYILSNLEKWVVGIFYLFILLLAWRIAQWVLNILVDFI
jgi:hypothetical protein